jgi:hypothetical protein
MNNYVMSLLETRQALAGQILEFLHLNPNVSVQPGNWPQGFNNHLRNAVCQQLNLQPNDHTQVDVARIILIANRTILNNIVINVDTLRDLNLLVNIPQIVQLQDQVNLIQQQQGELQAQIGGMQAQIGGMQAQIGGIEAQIGGLEVRIGGIEAQIGGLEVRIGGIEAQLAHIIQLLHR